MAITSKIVKITPKVAESWLATNNYNRVIRPTIVKKYADAMQRGEWMLSGQGITFDSKGNLIDGQHRLAAIVMSGVSIQMLVTEGVPPSTQDVIDMGVRRSLADILKIRGVPSSVSIATLLNWTQRLDPELYDDPRMQQAEKPTAQQSLKYFEKHPEIQEEQKLKVRTHHVTGRNELLIACYHHLRLIDENEADLFVDRLVTGAELTTDDPIYKLRGVLVGDKIARTRVVQVPIERGVYVAGLINVAWNYHLAGQPISTLRWNTKKKFPRPMTVDQITDPGSLEGDNED